MISVEPPSGTAALVNDNLSVKVVSPLAEGSPTWNVPVKGESVNPLPVTVPIRLTSRNRPCRSEIVEERRSKVNPPTRQKLLSGPELNSQGDARKTSDPMATLENEPDSALTTVGNQLTTSVAVWTVVVLS